MAYDLDTLTDHFAYLDDLRESGAANMLGAGQYLQEFRGLEKSEAREVLTHWMDTFDRNLTPSDRARAALRKASGKEG